MGKIKTPEEILRSNLTIETMAFGSPDYTYNKVIKSIEEYGKQRHNQAIKAAAENAKVLFKRYSTRSEVVSAVHGKTTYSVSKDSILKLLEP